jgi:hypothetical protein
MIELFRTLGLTIRPFYSQSTAAQLTAKDWGILAHKQKKLGLNSIASKATFPFVA